MSKIPIVDETLLISYSRELKDHCFQWANGLIASQYLDPYKIVVKYLSHFSEGHVLDWGCGNGHFSFFLLQLGLNVSGYSLHDELRETASLLRAQFPSKFSFQSATIQDPISLPYEEEIFDVIFSMGVLEHVREVSGNELASLREMHRILKPGGKIFVFHFPNQTSWIELANRACVKLGVFKKYTHPFLYTKRQIEEFASLSGFSLLEQGLYHLFPRNLFKRCPQKLGNNLLLLKSFILLENILSIPLKMFSQNHFFVLQKNS